MPENFKIKECGGMDAQEIKVAESRMKAIFASNGYDPDAKKQVSMKDALDIQGASFIIPRVLTQIVQEGIEPLLIGTRLLQRIDFVPGMETVFPAIDTLSAYEVADGASLPIVNINVAGGQSFAVGVKRHGLQLKVAKRFIERSTYPWLQYWLRLAGSALARHKEEYIFNFITSIGTTIFDNSASARTNGSAAMPLKGITTGRNALGAANGSMTADDIFDMYTQITMQGYIPDTLLVHPMAWMMFVRDPVFREFAIQAGGGSFFAQFTGNPASLANPFFNFNNLGQGQGQFMTTGQGAGTGDYSTNPANFSQTQTTAPQLPGYLPIPFRIVVSPFVRFDVVNKLTDIMMFSSRNLGALIVDYDPIVNSWDNQEFSIHNIGIEESYGLGVMNEGQAVGVARNVKIRPNAFVTPTVSMLNINESGSAYTNLEGSGIQFGDSPYDPTLSTL